MMTVPPTELKKLMQYPKRHSESLKLIYARLRKTLDGLTVLELSEAIRSFGTEQICNALQYGCALGTLKMVPYTNKFRLTMEKWVELEAEQA